VLVDFIFGLLKAVMTAVTTPPKLVGPELLPAGNLSAMLTGYERVVEENLR